jgi:TPR repeat protein
VKHLIIAAKLGHDMSVDLLKLCYRDGLVSKEDFAAALRGHQAAADATKSPQREAAEAFRKLGFGKIPKKLNKAGHIIDDNQERITKR